MALTALRDAARVARPETLGTSTLLLANERCIAIFDRFPKSKYHMLVLPRIPYYTAQGLTERDLDSPSSILRHPKAGDVISALAETAAEVEEMIVDEMVKTEGFAWAVHAGFHAVPSMRHLHLHVISGDLISPSLKTKKHYNSFRPDLGFFVPLSTVKGWAAEGAAAARYAEGLRDKDALLARELVCFKCGHGLSNMPALKRHLEDEARREREREDRSIGRSIEYTHRGT